MSAQPTPIRRQLIRMVLLTSAAVLLLTTADVVRLRVRHLPAGEPAAAGYARQARSPPTATAALAFDNSDDAEVGARRVRGRPAHRRRGALRPQRQAVRRLSEGHARRAHFPARPQRARLHYASRRPYLIGFLPVSEGGTAPGHAVRALRPPRDQRAHPLLWRHRRGPDRRLGAARLCRSRGSSSIASRGPILELAESGDGDLDAAATIPCAPLRPTPTSWTSSPAPSITCSLRSRARRAACACSLAT